MLHEFSMKLFQVYEKKHEYLNDFVTAISQHFLGHLGKSKMDGLVWKVPWTQDLEVAACVVIWVYPRVYLIFDGPLSNTQQLKICFIRRQKIKSTFLGLCTWFFFANGIFPTWNVRYAQNDTSQILMFLEIIKQIAITICTWLVQFCTRKRVI